MELQLAESGQSEVGQTGPAEQLRPRHHCEGPEGAGESPGGGDRQVQAGWTQ